MANPNSPVPESDLTATQFDALLRRLDTDRNRAGEKYEEVRWKLVRFFQWNCWLAAEELVDETLNRVAERVAERGDEIPDVAAFAWGVARKVRLEALRKDLKTVRLPDLPHVDSFVAIDRDSTDVQCELGQRRLECLRMCIQCLSPQDRRLLLRYHAPKGRRIEGRQRLAKENTLSMLALRVRANRLRHKLEECIRKHLAANAR